MRPPFTLVAVGIALVTACGYNPRPLPTPISGDLAGCPDSLLQDPPIGRLRAGFAKVDITPPPGVSLAGSGPEGKRARGYRLRLYARVIVLSDLRGERIAFIVADLPHVSLALQRFVAERLRCATGIGTDRLVFSATHTHSAPGNFYESRQYNRAGSSVPGYDSAGTEFLVGRIASAAIAAAKGLRPARLTWAATPVWGHTRNRSYDAYLLNRPLPTPPSEPPQGLDPVKQAVDPTWTMIRIDTVSWDRETYRPAGALSVFAIHGTGNPSENDLLDGDIHGHVERTLERAIDSLNATLDRRSYERKFRLSAVHLFANGTEGDVSPDWPAESRCGVPQLRPLAKSGGMRSPQRWGWEHPPPARVGECLALARNYVDRAGAALGDSAVAIFRRLDSMPPVYVRISRGFVQLHLARDADVLGLCSPAVGTSTAAGADDAVTRFAHWKFLGFFEVGLEEGGRAAVRPKGCQREKNLLLAHGLGRHDLPDVVQLMVVRLGPLLLAAVPAELTTEAGAQIRRAMAAAAGDAIKHVAIIGLANGFMQYVATDREYSAQTYEGGSTLYGPRSAAFLASELASLTSQLRKDGWHSPPALMEADTMFPGPSSRIFPARIPVPNPLPRLDEPKATCSGDTLTLKWRDTRAGTLLPADSAVLEIQDSTRFGWSPVTWDDDPRVEVRMVRAYKEGADWEMRWAVPRRAVYRVELLPRADQPYTYYSTTRRCPE